VDKTNSTPAAVGSTNGHLGVPLVFGPDELAPAVHHGRVRSLVRNELRGETLDETCQLVATFRSWYEAWRHAIDEETGQAK
jgi:hypothetical protein